MGLTGHTHCICPACFFLSALGQFSLGRDYFGICPGPELLGQDINSLTSPSYLIEYRSRHVHHIPFYGRSVPQVFERATEPGNHIFAVYCASSIISPICYVYVCVTRGISQGQFPSGAYARFPGSGGNQIGPPSSPYSFE